VLVPGLFPVAAPVAVVANGRRFVVLVKEEFPSDFVAI